MRASLKEWENQGQRLAPHEGPRFLAFTPIITVANTDGVQTMDAVKEIDDLKIKKQEQEKRLLQLGEKKADIERQIVDAKSKLTGIEQEIFQRENIVFLEAAKMAVSSNPQFEKLVKDFAEKITLESVARKPKKGRPRKDASQH